MRVWLYRDLKTFSYEKILQVQNPLEPVLRNKLHTAGDIFHIFTLQSSNRSDQLPGQSTPTEEGRC